MYIRNWRTLMEADSLSERGVTVQGWGGSSGDYGEETEQLTEIDVTVRSQADL